MSMPAHTAGPGGDRFGSATAPDPARVGSDDADAQVLRLLGEGCSVAEIATRLGLSVFMARKRIERVYGRVGCQSRRLQAAEYVARHGYQLGPTRTPCLTERQSQVLTMISEGCSNAQIADALALSPATVRSHIASLYARIGARNRAQATRYAMNLQHTTPTLTGVPATA